MLNKKLTAFAQCFVYVSRRFRSVYVCVCVCAYGSVCYMHVYANRCTLSLISVDGCDLFFHFIYFMHFAHEDGKKTSAWKNERNIICIVMRNVKLITHNDFKQRCDSFFCNMKFAMDKSLSLSCFTRVLSMCLCNVNMHSIASSVELILLELQNRILALFLPLRFHYSH